MTQEMQLFDNNGQRLYLTPEERERFALMATKQAASNEARTFARTLYYTGCRISEALAVTNAHIDIENRTIVFRTLKKRKDPKTGQQKIVHRAVPVPDSFIDELNLVHNIKTPSSSFRLWPWSRATGWSRIKEIMLISDIEGVHATPKGLRHGFGVASVLNDVPLPTLKKWLGHEKLETTAIYTQAVGEEERALAARGWD